MRALILLSMSLLAGCATVGSDPVAPSAATRAENTSGLPAQTLAPGECGLFGWTKTDSPVFTFFATSRRAKTDKLQLIPLEDAFPSATYRAVELGEDSLVRLDLGEAELLDGGRRYANARLTIPGADGWETVQPIAAILSCQR